MNFRILQSLVWSCCGVLSTLGFAANTMPLEKGMTTETVIRVVGKPQKVEPMETTAGQAEVWTYRRVYRRYTEQQATGVQEVPAFVALGGPLGVAKEITYSIRQVTIYQVTSLLMFNGQLVHAKQWMERENGAFQ